MDTAVAERRAAARFRAVSEHAIVSARIRPGYDAAIVDVSAEGALVDTPCRMLPNRSVDLQLTTAVTRVAVRARVLRCSVVSVTAACISYRAAMRFDTPLAWLVSAAGDYSIGVDAGAHRVAEREPATRDRGRLAKGSRRNGC